MKSSSKNRAPSSEVGGDKKPSEQRLSLAVRSAKSAARLLATLLVSWRVLIYRASALVLDRERAFAAASESIARIPGMRGVYQRQAFYRRTLAACGAGIYFGWQTVFSKSGAKLGDGVYLGRHCSLGLVEIGDHSMLSDGVQVLSGRRQHGTERGGPSFKEQAQTFDRIRIGRNSWIGTNAIIMADIGDSTIIGAGAVVIDPIPENSVAAGVPAELKRRLE